MYKIGSTHSPDCHEIRKAIENMTAYSAEQIQPMLTEILLREYILGVGDTNEFLNIYCGASGNDPKSDVRVLVLKSFGAADLTECSFDWDAPLMCTTVDDFFLAVVTDCDDEKIENAINNTRTDVKNHGGDGLLAAYSENTQLNGVRETYDRLKTCIGYTFYPNCDRTLRESDLRKNDDVKALKTEYMAVEGAVKSGDGEKVKTLMASFFKRLVKQSPKPETAIDCCLELYVCVLRGCDVESVDSYIDTLAEIRRAESLDAVRKRIEETSLEIASNNTPEKRKVYSSLIRDTIKIIDENLDNENLSLRWLAGSILYTNVDYLGKLFKKETGKNFSHYVMEKRMELAKDIIMTGKMDRIYEVAENVGYGSNSQYFSQVFKKYTGVSPLEYKEFSRLVREKNKPENNS